MASSELQSPDHLVALSENGNLEQLFAALSQPATAQTALRTDNILVSARTNTWCPQLNLHRMLEAAARNGHVTTVEHLLTFGQKHGVAVDEMVTMDTMGAALNSKPLEVLLAFHAVDPDVFSRRLHIGTDLVSVCSHGGPDSEEIPRNGYLALLQHLMRAGFDANGPSDRYRRSLPRNRQIEPPLYWAAWMASAEIVECFLAHGAVVAGSKAMRSASANGRMDVLEMLLQYGGDACVNEASDEEDIDGLPGTPLHVAVAAGNEDVVRWLLDHGADVSVRDRKGMTARDVMGEDDGGAILVLLEKAERLSGMPPAA